LGRETNVLTAFVAFLTALPAVTGGITSFLTAYNDAKVRMLQARAGVTRDVAVAAISGAVTERVSVNNVIAGSKALQFLIIAFALPIVAFEWKVVMWDTMLGWGSTPAVRGEVAVWMGTIVNWLFGSTTALVAGSAALKTVQSIMSK
jgi:hypothetical protein